MAPETNIMKTDHVIAIQEVKKESEKLPTNLITSFFSRPRKAPQMKMTVLSQESQHPNSPPAPDLPNEPSPSPLFEIILCYGGMFLLAIIFYWLMKDIHKEKANE